MTNQIQTPNSWNEITVDQFVEFSELKREEFGSDYDYMFEKTAIILNKKSEDIAELPYEDFLELVDKIEFITKSPSKRLKEKITHKTEGDFYYYGAFNKLLIGEFIDLEHYFADGYYKNFKIICSILYRKVVKEQSKLYNQQLEEYGDYIYLRQDLWSEMPITDLYYIIPTYLTWRDNLFKNYEGLFGSSEVEEIDEERLQKMDAFERAEVMKAIDHEKKTKKWAWESFLLSIAGGDNLRVKDVLKENLMLQLNLLSRKHELGE